MMVHAYVFVDFSGVGQLDATSLGDVISTASTLTAMISPYLPLPRCSLFCIKLTCKFLILTAMHAGLHHCHV